MSINTDSTSGIVNELYLKFGPDTFIRQQTADKMPTLWADKDNIIHVLKYLRDGITRPYRMLYDLFAVDERTFRGKEGRPESDFTVIYHLLSFERNEYLRIKVALKGEYPSIPSITGIWPNANWYEREIYDMLGINVDGHPDLRRILMPKTWKGHPLRKEHPARATEMGVFELNDDKQEAEEEKLKFHPEDFGLKRSSEGSDFMFLNMGPHHPGTHGVLRLVLQLDGEDIVDIVPDIGFHHRGAEKMAERQTWHTYIPYTDRVDYLGGVVNNLAYLLAVEKLAGIEVPERAKMIRVMMCEFFRIQSHLVWFGTFAQDLGQMSPVMYMFTDRENIFDFVTAVTGYRMHPVWFRIGGTAHDLPKGWDSMVRNFLNDFPKRLKEYNNMVMKNPIIRRRAIGIGCFTLEEAMDWGATGPNLRACGFEWDFRKKQPYSGYEQFEFDIPTGVNGDCYDRGRVRVEEMYQSLRIIEQCLKNMPGGPYKSHNPLATPPVKNNTMKDIETLITHFLNVTWGPVIPMGEAFFGIEATKGNNGYYLISDGDVCAYRLRIRTPSFPHIQMVPLISRGHTIADLISILGSIDFVLADVDR